MTTNNRYVTANDTAASAITSTLFTIEEEKKESVLEVSLLPSF